MCRAFLIWDTLLMEMVDARCVRSSMIYGSETRPVLADVGFSKSRYADNKMDV